MAQGRLVQIGDVGGILFIVFQPLGEYLIQIGGREPSFGATTQ